MANCIDDDFSTNKERRVVTLVKCNKSDLNIVTQDNSNYPTSQCSSGSTSTNSKVINHTLTINDIAAGYIMLPYPADPLYLDQCMLFVDSGPVILPPLSYEIVDSPIPQIFNRLEWIGRELQEVLEVGDYISFHYIALPI